MNSSFYTDIDYGSSSGAAGLTGAIAAFIGVVWIIAMGMCVLQIIAMWKIFTKANKPGWASIVPIYNIYTLLQIAEVPTWYLLLLIIPVANIYATFKMYIELAHKFGKDTGFGIGLVLLNPVFILVLAFGGATYNGNSNMSYQNNMNGSINNTNSNMGYQNNMNSNMNNNMNNNMNTQPVTPTQTPIQNNVPVEPMVQNTNTSFELPKTEPDKQEFIAQEPAAPVVENKFVQPNIEVPNTEPITDVKNNNVQ